MPAFTDDYLEENPNNFSREDLDAIRAWQEHQIDGRFMIHQERKDGCLVATTEGEKLYLVLGLTQPISELVPFLPIYVETRLVPFWISPPQMES